MNITHFINTHGVESLVIAYILSAILSGLTSTPLPPNAGYWAQSFYHIASILKGNLAQYMKSAPPDPPKGTA